MTEDGKLSKRDRDTVLKTTRILEGWLKAQAEQGRTKDNSFIVHDVDDAASLLWEFVLETQ